MGSIRQYILSVVCVAILCGIVQLFFTGSKLSGTVQFITGLMVTITVMSPALQIQELQLDAYFSDVQADASWFVSDGEEAARDMTSQIIKERTSAYICDKARGLGTEIVVNVELDSDMVPIGVVMSGRVSPYAKKQITGYLKNELGITEDRQIWIS